MIESFESAAAVAASIGRLYRARAPERYTRVSRAAVIVNVCTRDGGSIKEEWMRYTMREMPIEALLRPVIASKRLPVRSPHENVCPTLNNGIKDV